jgi:hypothetical protein
MDPRMVAVRLRRRWVRQGLLPQVQDQLARSQSPERMQGWQNFMTRGQQMMGGSVAGNPFSQPGGYMGGLNFGAIRHRAGNGRATNGAPDG